MLDGKKTYIVSIIGFLLAFYEWYTTGSPDKVLLIVSAGLAALRKALE